jgi:hypothetical protein
VNKDVLSIISKEVNTKISIAFIGHSRDHRWPPRMSCYFCPNYLVLLEFHFLFAWGLHFLHFDNNAILFILYAKLTTIANTFAVLQNTYKKAAIQQDPSVRKLSYHSQSRDLTRKTWALRILLIFSQMGQHINVGDCEITALSLIWQSETSQD